MKAAKIRLPSSTAQTKTGWAKGYPKPLSQSPFDSVKSGRILNDFGKKRQLHFPGFENSRNVEMISVLPAITLESAAFENSQKVKIVLYLRPAGDIGRGQSKRGAVSSLFEVPRWILKALIIAPHPPLSPITGRGKERQNARETAGSCPVLVVNPTMSVKIQDTRVREEAAEGRDWQSPAKRTVVARKQNEPKF